MSCPRPVRASPESYRTLSSAFDFRSEPWLLLLTVEAYACSQCGIKGLEPANTQYEVNTVPFLDFNTMIKEILQGRSSRTHHPHILRTRCFLLPLATRAHESKTESRNKTGEDDVESGPRRELSHIRLNGNSSEVHAACCAVRPRRTIRIFRRLLPHRVMALLLRKTPIA